MRTEEISGASEGSDELTGAAERSTGRSDARCVSVWGNRPPAMTQRQPRRQPPASMTTAASVEWSKLGLPPLWRSESYA